VVKAPADREADAELMRRAVRVAHTGLGATYPNPCVGALVVQRGRIVGAAKSRPTGGAHAEPQAIARAGEDARGATLYVTLEPCVHHGRTPPCTEAILAAGIGRVVVGVFDPARHANGHGVARLRAAGLTVDVGLAAAECAALHEHYLHHVRTGRPFVTLKAAASLDGRIATASGDSKWITSERARKHVHRMRAEHHAIAVGATTVLLDDPRLDVRHVRGVDPIPFVLDSSLQLGAKDAPRRRILRAGTTVLHGPRASAAAIRRVAATGAEPVEVRCGKDGHLDPRAVLRVLGRRSIRSLLVEGGGRVHGAFFAANAWDRMLLYQAPRLLGDTARPLLSGVAWPTVRTAPAPVVEARKILGPDLLWILRPRPRRGAAAGLPVV
jgi:diaminohydroxyphosphoribosylaminopyrimidine deaminase/5-amino-6-(5-phosphoribosylamino)uracil reductase